MNYLIAKSGRNYSKILSQENEILNTFDFKKVNGVNYSSSYKLDEEEWFMIDSFSEKEFCIDQCDVNFSTVNLNQIANKDYDRIRSLCVMQNDEIHFQKITPSLFIKKKTFLDYSGEPQIIEQRKHIEIRKISDAIYSTEKDILYFKHLAKIKSVFPGIEELHREATQEEVDTFLNYEFIELSEFTSTKVGTLNRKRIADIGAKYNTLSNRKQNKLIKYARDKADINLNGNNFIIDSENALKNLLYAMDQRYYYADIYNENRIANSIKVV